MRLARSTALLLLLLGACLHRPPPPATAPAPPPPLAVAIPPGCGALLGGRWVHRGDDSWRYLAVDDGGTLTLWPERTAAGEAPTGATTRSFADAGVEVVLVRSPQGFTGATRALAFTSTGGACEVAFPTEVVSCGDGGLLLRSAASASFDDQCRPPSAGPLAPRVEHLLLVAPAAAPATDGGARP